MAARRAALHSVQPSSGQQKYGVTDQDEERLGMAVADAAGRAGVVHLVYTSVAYLGPGTGVGHFESKWRIEEYIRRSRLPATIVRPATFMELLLEPLFGLTRGHLNFFTRHEQSFQLIAVADIGRLVARVFADPARHLGAPPSPPSSAAPAALKPATRASRPMR